MTPNALIERLETFIKKYYQNQLLKGAILSISLVAILFFAISFFEYWGRFGISIRTSLFVIFIALCMAVITWYIIRPVLCLINVSRQFGIREASILIGNHFPEVKDKLLNTIQLQENAKAGDHSLLIASIEQRITELKPIPFSNAIPFKDNIKYVKYAFLPAIALVFILLVSPGFKKSSDRFVHFGQHFEIEAPFTFNSNLHHLHAIQNQTIDIPLSIEGDKIPQDAYIHIGNQRYKMQGVTNGKFNYTLSNIQKSERIFFEAGGFSSKEYELAVLLKPSIVGYSATITYPAYLSLPSETVRNIGELNVPQGTVIRWSFNTKNVKGLHIVPEGSTLKPVSNKISFTRKFMKSTVLKVNTLNEDVPQGDSILYQINVTPDEYPQIAVEKKEDSLSQKIYYFLGDISDDHGFSKLTFHYQFTKSSKAENKEKSGVMPVALTKNITSQHFYHYWNLNIIDVQAEDEI